MKVGDLVRVISCQLERSLNNYGVILERVHCIRWLADSGKVLKINGSQRFVIILEGKYLVRHWM